MADASAANRPDPGPDALGPLLSVARSWRPLAIALIAAMCLAPIAPAATDSGYEPLSTSRAIELALENSHRLRAADAGVLAAEAGTQEAKAARLPRLEIEEQFMRSTNPVLVFGNLLRQESFTEENFDLDNLNSPDALNNFGTQVNLFQPIWSGGQISSGIEASVFGLHAATAGRERTRQQVVHQVIGAYAAAVVADQQLVEAEASRNVVQANLQLVRDLFEGGLVVESDLLQALVRESELEELVVRSESGVEISRTALNLAMGFDPGCRWELEELNPETLAATGDDLEELTEIARSRRPDLRGGGGAGAGGGESGAHGVRRTPAAGRCGRWLGGQRRGRHRRRRHQLVGAGRRQVDGVRRFCHPCSPPSGPTGGGPGCRNEGPARSAGDPGGAARPTSICVPPPSARRWRSARPIWRCAVWRSSAIAIARGW